MRKILKGFGVLALALSFLFGNGSGASAHTSVQVYPTDADPYRDVIVYSGDHGSATISAYYQDGSGKWVLFSSRYFSGGVPSGGYVIYNFPSGSYVKVSVNSGGHTVSGYAQLF